MKVGDFEHPVQKDMLQVGQAAPDFTLITPRNAKKTLADYAGLVKVISCVPSVDTRVCDAQTRRFNVEAAGLGEGVVILTVSADLPFALGRYCATNGIDRTETLSCSRDMQFADDYGVHDTEWRVCQRALFVLDRDNVVRYAEYVPVIGDDVDFAAGLAAAKAALG
jgi:thiol peroxidase